MSLEVSTRIWQQSTLRNADKLLLLAIGEMADKDGFCWPSIKTLSEMTGQNTRQVIRILIRLRETDELIIWDQQGQHGGRGYTNLYFIKTGLTEAEIREIISRRFEAIEAEISQILAQNGDLYVRLCHLKRLTPETLLKTRKTVISDTIPEKRVTNSTEKGDTSDTRTSNEPANSKIKDISGSPPKPPKPKEPKEYSPKQKIMFAVAAVCRLDLSLATEKTFGQLGQTAGKLEKAGRTPEQVDDFGKWWYANDWRGEKDQAPLPSQILECWGNFEHWIQAGRPAKEQHTNGHQRNNGQGAGKQPAGAVTKRVDVKTGRTYWWDSKRKCEVPAPA